MFLENYLWFILLGESFFVPVEASIRNSDKVNPVKAPDRLSSMPDIPAVFGMPEGPCMCKVVKKNNEESPIELQKAF